MADVNDPTGDQRWWRDAVIYQVYVRSFADSDGDGVGDLAGITARLPHLTALGCRRAVDHAVLHLPAARPRLRRRRLLRHRPALRRPRRRRRADRASPRARAARDRRPRAQPLLLGARVVPGGPGRGAGLCRARPLPLPHRPGPGRGAAQQLGVRLRRARPGPGSGTPTSGTSTSSTPPSPTSTGATPRSATCSRTSCASGSTAAWTASGWTSRTASSRRSRCATRRSRGSRPGQRRARRWSSAQVTDEPMWDQPEVHDVYRRWAKVLDEYGADRMAVAEAWTQTAESLARLHPPRRARPGLQLRVAARGLVGHRLRRGHHRHPGGRGAGGLRADMGAVATTTSPGTSPATAAVRSGWRAARRRP